MPLDHEHRWGGRNREKGVAVKGSPDGRQYVVPSGHGAESQRGPHGEEHTRALGQMIRVEHCSQEGSIVGGQEADLTDPVPAYQDTKGDDEQHGVEHAAGLRELPCSKTLSLLLKCVNGLHAAPALIVAAARAHRWLYRTSFNAPPNVVGYPACNADKDDARQFHGTDICTSSSQCPRDGMGPRMPFLRLGITESPHEGTQLSNTLRQRVM